MAKQVSRKKQLKNQLRRLHKINPSPRFAPEKAEIKKVIEQVTNSVEKTKLTVEEFATHLEGITTERVQTFYEAGIQSMSDFEKWTEKELLALKGIGPATIKKLKELGVHFQA